MIGKLIELYKRTFWNREKYGRSLGVKIGTNCNIQKISFGSEPYLIEIGDHVQITVGTKLFTHGGGWVFRHKHPKMDFFGKIKIGNNVYIGNNAMIMPGVTIEDNVIVAAGSVVTKSVVSGSIVAGNPAKVIGNLNDFENKIIPFNVNSKGMGYEEKKKFLLALSEDKFIKK